MELIKYLINKYNIFFLIYCDRNKNKVSILTTINKILYNKIFWNY